MERSGNWEVRPTEVTKQLFFPLSSRNIQLNLLYLPSNKTRLMHHLEGCHPLILSCHPRPLKSFDLMVLNLNAPIGKDGRQCAHFYPVPANYAKIIFRPNYALVNKRTWRSFSLLRGLRARLLCGHAEYLTSRLCQPMGIVVIFFFFVIFAPSSQVPKVTHPICGASCV